MFDPIRKPLPCALTPVGYGALHPTICLAMEDAVKILLEEEMPFLALSQEDYEAWTRANVLDVDDEAG